MTIGSDEDQPFRRWIVLAALLMEEIATGETLSFCSGTTASLTAVNTTVSLTAVNTTECC